MPQTKKQILLNANEAIANGDHESFLAHCTDDTEWNFLGDRVLKGKAAVRQFMKETYLRPPEVTVESLLSEGDTLVAVGTISINGAAKQEYCDVWQFREGKLDKLKAFVV